MLSQDLEDTLFSSKETTYDMNSLILSDSQQNTNLLDLDESSILNKIKPVKSYDRLINKNFRQFKNLNTKTQDILDEDVPKNSLNNKNSHLKCYIQKKNQDEAFENFNKSENTYFDCEVPSELYSVLDEKKVLQVFGEVLHIKDRSSKNNSKFNLNKETRTSNQKILTDGNINRCDLDELKKNSFGINSILGNLDANLLKLNEYKENSIKPSIDQNKTPIKNFFLDNFSPIKPLENNDNNLIYSEIFNESKIFKKPFPKNLKNTNKSNLNNSIESINLNKFQSTLVNKPQIKDYNQTIKNKLQSTLIKSPSINCNQTTANNTNISEKNILEMSIESPSNLLNEDEIKKNIDNELTQLKLKSILKEKSNTFKTSIDSFSSNEDTSDKTLINKRSFKSKTKKENSNEYIPRINSYELLKNRIKNLEQLFIDHSFKNMKVSKSDIKNNFISNYDKSGKSSSNVNDSNLESTIDTSLELNRNIGKIDSIVHSDTLTNILNDFDLNSINENEKFLDSYQKFNDTFHCKCCSKNKMNKLNDKTSTKNPRLVKNFNKSQTENKSVNLPLNELFKMKSPKSYIKMQSRRKEIQEKVAKRLEVNQLKNRSKNEKSRCTEKLIFTTEKKTIK